MKLCHVVAIFLIGVIPVKITHVYSQAELHWGARGSGRPPKISRLIPKMYRGEPSINGTSDDSRGSAKLGYDRNLNTCKVSSFKRNITFAKIWQLFEKKKHFSREKPFLF